VLILPDAALHKLPFEAMVTRKGGTAAATGYWLDDGPPVRYAASATIVLALAARPVGGASDGSVLSVSDPAYQAAEARTAPAASRLWAELGGSARMATGLPPLPGTKRETEEIIKRFAGKVTWLQGPDATEGNLRASIAGMQYVHLATHGLVDESRGALFSALALAPPAHAAVSTDDDGFLELHEVYSLNLKSCELAILSACQTNAGHQIEGEGVFALSRGFLAAGAARVIASQWPVDDISTAAAVGDFFGRIGMASKQNGGYARALREAKKTIRNQAQWAAPYFWAPLVLIGAE
jgi:CHAT domain-containing protein